MNSLEQFHQLTTKELLTNPDVFADARTLTASSATWGTIQTFEPNELTLDNKIWSNASSQSEPQQIADEKAAESLRFPFDDRATRELREKLFEQDPNLRREWWEQESRNEDARMRYWRCQEEHSSKIPDGFEQNKWIHPPKPYDNECQLDINDYYRRAHPEYNPNAYQYPGRPNQAPRIGVPGSIPIPPGRTHTFSPSLEPETKWKPETAKTPDRNQDLSSG